MELVLTLVVGTVVGAVAVAVPSWREGKRLGARIQWLEEENSELLHWNTHLQIRVGVQGGGGEGEMGIEGDELNGG